MVKSLKSAISLRGAVADRCGRRTVTIATINLRFADGLYIRCTGREYP